MVRKQKNFDLNNKTGYHYFVAKFWETEKNEGNIMSFEEAKLKASWNGLTANDREKYKKLAIEVGEEEVEKMINVIKENDAEIERIKKLKQKVINEKVDEFFDFVMQEDYETRTFYIAHCNWYIKDSKKNFYPGEICIIKYNVLNGIFEKIVLDLDCGPFPVGYGNQINQRSADVNKLPIPPSQNALKYPEAMKEIKKFYNGENPQILFALDDDENNDILAVKQALNKIFEREYIIVPIERLFMELFTKYRPNDVLHIKKARDILKESRTDSMACNHHFNLDAKMYCSENHASRFALNMSDALFPKLANRVNPSNGNNEIVLQPNTTNIETIAEEEIENEENIPPPDTPVQSENHKPIQIDHMPITEELEDFDLDNLLF
ncbi:hypothetical protein PVAND_005078 [Polypedilum vanderplanki]|uniref:Maelstrom domain-containing protein n=1 Tax=Polypedilum vanderplanki TaxID=319348 RepID=A0A9J6BZQ2_POLVA|nr:hypothetical protein PVAND_005078 [Polypedilum vanderplanki]